MYIVSYCSKNPEKFGTITTVVMSHDRVRTQVFKGGIVGCLGGGVSSDGRDDNG